MDASAHQVKLAEQLFSPYSGNLLDSDNSTGDAYCALSGYRIPVHELKKTVTVSRSNLKAFRLRYGVEPLVPDADAIAEQNTQRQRATIDESCPKCGVVGLEFYTMQLRSADEGQTVFYECTSCGHKFSQNN